MIKRFQRAEKLRESMAFRILMKTIHPTQVDVSKDDLGVCHLSLMKSMFHPSLEQCDIHRPGSDLD